MDESTSVEWTKIADIQMSIFIGSVVQPIDRGIVVMSAGSTKLVGFDGLTMDGEKPPVTISAGCCGSAIGIPVGEQLILFDSYAPSTWLLDSGSMTWTQIGDRPSTGDVLGSALIGEQIYVVTAVRSAVNAPVAALNTTTWEWSEIESVPMPISVGGVATDGKSLFVAGVQQDGNNNIVGESGGPALFEYEAGVWSQLPHMPIGGQAATVAWVEGAGLLAWNYDLESALLTAGEDWEAMGTVPMDRSECYPYSDQVDSGVVAVCGGLAHFDAESQSWTPISTSIHSRYVATENAVYELTPSGDQTTLAFRLLNGEK